ncbi:hypothetical protein HA402_006496 [Bradysia odoriphaga]|nr:hypothetical protein HA402_006496 [Bradysia odoriphaga]
MVNISLSLDRSDRKYNAGDVINLEARVQVNSEQKYRTIYARVQGYAHVEWTESRQVQRDGKSHTEYTTYSSHETMFQQYQTLAGTRSGPEERLTAGTYVYHARFVLPASLPENHENDYGHIRYEAKVHMDVPWGFDEKERTSFYINPRFDLNEFPHLREPVHEAASKTFGCCCWESEPLQIFNVLPRRGFVPGDRVPYSIELKNDSDVAIDSATVRLVERIVYHAHSPRSKTRESSRTLWSYDFTSGNNRQLVSALQNKVYSTEIYFNPSWDFQYFTGCGIITVEYHLKSKARTSGCHTNLSNDTLITVGTISSGIYESRLPPLAPMAPLMPFPSAPSAPPGEPISEQPLPSYSDTQSKPMAPGVGWAGTASMETPPPTFTEIEFLNKNGKQEKQ